VTDAGARQLQRSSSFLLLAKSLFYSSGPETSAIYAIELMGGTVTFDEKSPGKPVIAVYLRGVRLHYAGLVGHSSLLEYLKDLPKIQTLSLDGTDITDAGLEHLEGLTLLQTLSLIGTKVTDAGVKRLQKALPNCHIQR